MAQRQTYHWNNVTLTPSQAAQALWQAGLRDYNIMAQLVAIAKRESGYQAGVHGSDSPQSRVSGDRGVWQINAGEDGHSVDDQLRAAGIIQRPEDLFDPVVNARAVLWLIGGANASPQSQQNAINHHWGAGPNGWEGASGDPLYGTDINIGLQAVQQAQSGGLFGPNAPPVPASVTSGAGAAAAGPGANPGGAELGWINAYAQNQREYYIKQAEFNTKLRDLGIQGVDYQILENDANKMFQQALSTVYTDVNKAQSMFNAREFAELRRNISEMSRLQIEGKGNTDAFMKKRSDVLNATYKASVEWIAKQRGFSQRQFDQITKFATQQFQNSFEAANRQYDQSVSEATFARDEQARQRTSEATAKGAYASEGFGQDLKSFDTQRWLAMTQADLTRDIGVNEATLSRDAALEQAGLARDVDFARLTNEQKQQYLQYWGQRNQNWYDQQQAQTAFEAQREQFRNAWGQGQLRYDQTAKQLWAKARELAEQAKLNETMVGLQYKGLLNQRDVIATQAAQAHHSLENQHNQVGVNAFRDIAALNQARQAASNQALLSLSPYQ